MALDVAVGLVLLGVCILAAALIPAGKLIARRPSGRPRYSWVALAALMLVFIFGYIGYASIRWNADTRLADLGLPLVFFGVCLVLAVSTLALSSVQYVRRLTVLENENINDSLMGIPNYRYFIARLNEEVARSIRYKLPLSLLMVDVDHLRKINETYGHTVGDLVLIALARVVLSVARDTDMAARFGRQEIAVIAPNTTAADAARLAERIRHAVETTSLLPVEVNGGGDGAGVTVSIGVSSLGPHSRNAQALIVAASAARLDAKHGAPNRITVR